MKVLHYVNLARLEGGGPIRAVLDWVAVLPLAGLEVTLMTLDARDVPADWRAGKKAGVRVIELADGARSFLGRRQREQAAAAVRECDVLHLHGVWVPSNLQLARLARRMGRPYVLTPHGTLDRWAISQKALKKRLYLAFAGRRMLEGASAVHFTAEAEAEQAREWIRAKRECVLPLPFDLAPYEGLEVLPAEAREPAMLFLGRIHPVKGLEVLLEALAILRREGRGVRLRIAGGGEEVYVRSLKERARSLGVESAVEWLGMVHEKAKVQALSTASLMALPSIQENYGIVLVEALACGTPVVTSRGVDIWRELESAGGLIVERTADGFASGIRRLLDDSADRSRRGEAGRKWVFESLAPAALAAAYAEFYGELVAGLRRA